MKSKNIDDEDFLTEADLKECQTSFFYIFCIITLGPIFGIFVAILSPILIILGPICYIFFIATRYILTLFLVFSTFSKIFGGREYRNF